MSQVGLFSDTTSAAGQPKWRVHKPLWNLTVKTPLAESRLRSTQLHSLSTDVPLTRRTNRRISNTLIVASTR